MSHFAFFFTMTPLKNFEIPAEVFFCCAGAVCCLKKLLDADEDEGIADISVGSIILVVDIEQYVPPSFLLIDEDVVGKPLRRDDVCP